MPRCFAPHHFLLTRSWLPRLLGWMMPGRRPMDNMAADWDRPQVVHLIRDPYVLYPSTLHLWRLLYCIHGLQRPSWEGLPEYILDTFVRMYDRLEEDKRLVPPGRFHELRYEDLVRDPVGRLQALYRALDLGDFGLARPYVERHLAGLENYEMNRYVLTPSERSTITRRWGAVIRRYGYAVRAD